MERYMWSFDGQKMSEVKAPIPFLKGERVRVTLVNDTMMSHPIHLHGHFFELVTGHGEYAPRKHTVRSEEHTSELQSLMRISYAVFCLKKKYMKDITPVTVHNLKLTHDTREFVLSHSTLT